MFDVRCSMFLREKGIALVITLVLLAVITFLAIAFLALTRRERGSVTTTADQTTARLAAEAGLERAIMHALSPVLTVSNEYQTPAFVSTNFINAAGYYVTLPGSGDPLTNNNYQWQLNGAPLNDPVDRARAMTNLFYEPRPPVYVVTNRVTGGSDFRFYLDLNRNGRFDTNGFIPELNNFGIPIVLNGVTNYGHFMGDPEWIGILERTGQPHSSSNRFIGRYAFIAVPISQSLDLNYMHNQALTRALNPGNDGFFRNHGVGPWELNLAAFLTDLNTNAWANPVINPQYQYRRPNSLNNQGNAFIDALSLLNYRYANNYNNLRTANQFFGVPRVQVTTSPFLTDLIDEYSDGVLMTNTWLMPEDNTALPNSQDNPDLPWAGSDNPRKFFTLQELFDPARSSFLFTNRLGYLGTSNDSYNRYTFYRMMAQLGTDSVAENKININYDNRAQRNVNSGAVAATNLYAWRPIDFFTNAADRLLRDTNLCPYPGLSITNIPLWTATANQVRTNFYTPAVHRLLQLAANIYDSTTVSNYATAIATNGFPSVFRPVFRKDPTSIAIVGYMLVNDHSINGGPVQGLTNALDANDPVERSRIPDGIDFNGSYMIAGVPAIVGAKKGFPSFNEVAAESVVEVTRRLEFVKPINGNTVVETNQMYTLSVTNFYGVELWNSYATTYPRQIDMIGQLQVMAVITNELGVIVRTNSFAQGTYNLSTNITANSWRGFQTRPGTPATTKALSFVLPIRTSAGFVATEIYRQNQSGGGFLTALANGFPVNNSEGFPVPQLFLTIRCRLNLVMVDREANRIIDVVNLDNLDQHVDVMGRISGYRQGVPTAGIAGFNADSLWETNRLNNSTAVTVPTRGILYQINVANGNIAVSENVWASYRGTQSKPASILAFNQFMNPSSSGTFGLSNRMQSPFNPTRYLRINDTWQANDPLVHYTADDLRDLTKTPENKAQIKEPVEIALVLQNEVLKNLRAVNERYQPWPNQNGQVVGTDNVAEPDEGGRNVGKKDPLITRSDDWDFPTNRFPSVGWLGRVHRGTPWQTIYLKSPQTAQDVWAQWSGHADPTNALASLPRKDRVLFDHFTAAPNDNALLGLLGVNQTELAAWSAALSGVVVLSNSSPNATPDYTWFPIQPAGVSGGTNSPLWQMVHGPLGINAARASTNLNPSLVFKHLGDVLSTPALTVQSPYLNTNNLLNISDPVYERIPQQVLGLLTLSAPRFEIYSYGQALKPAPRSIVTSGGQFGLCTNYQITAEAATRTVVRIEGAPTNTHAVVESFNILPPD